MIENLVFLSVSSNELRKSFANTFHNASCLQVVESGNISETKS